MPRRRAEARVRRRAVTLVKGASVSLHEGGGLLDVRAHTLRGWVRRKALGMLVARPLGRPLCGRDPATLGQVRELAREAGPGVSVRYVRERLGWIPRAVVEEEVRSWKKGIRRERRADMQRLRWEGPGRVWSCDWTQPGMPVDGAFKEILAVRDLPSRKTLDSLPCERRSSHLAAQRMEGLFIAQGPPLVMKSDGGAEFKAGPFTDLMVRYGVTPLVSPGYYPQYNGAIEAGIGSLKAHAWYEAAKNGRVGYWTCDDVEAGRMKANETSRPLGPCGPSPDMLWDARPKITRSERRAFLKILKEERRRTVQEHGAQRTVRERKADERHAVQKALERCGYLTVARRRVSLREN